MFAKFQLRSTVWSSTTDASILLLILTLTLIPTYIVFLSLYVCPRICIATIEHSRRRYTSIQMVFWRTWARDGVCTRNALTLAGSRLVISCFGVYTAVQFMHNITDSTLPPSIVGRFTWFFLRSVAIEYVNLTEYVSYFSTMYYCQHQPIYYKI